MIYKYGGMIWGGFPLKRILIKDGEAKGVELENGDIIEADKAVVREVNAHITDSLFAEEAAEILCKLMEG